MVDISGHVAFGLLFAVVAWFFWDDRASVAFVGLAVVGSLLPDADLWLSKLFPDAVHHHGVTHTIVFVAIASVVGGALIAGLLARPIDEWIDSERFDRGSLFVFATTAFLLGGLSHITADLLSSPDISTPLEPLWPFYKEPIIIDVVWYNAWWINAGFLAVMIAVHLVLAYVTTPRDHRYRLSPTR